jgi:hypothetical protein
VVYKLLQLFTTCYNYLQLITRLQFVITLRGIIAHLFGIVQKTRNTASVVHVGVVNSFHRMRNSGLVGDNVVIHILFPPTCVRGLGWCVRGSQHVKVAQAARFEVIEVDLT